MIFLEWLKQELINFTSFDARSQLAGITTATRNTLTTPFNVDIVWGATNALTVTHPLTLATAPGMIATVIIAGPNLAQGNPQPQSPMSCRIEYRVDTGAGFGAWTLMDPSWWDVFFGTQVSTGTTFGEYGQPSFTLSYTVPPAGFVTIETQRVIRRLSNNGADGFLESIGLLTQISCRPNRTLFA